ncbi:DUF4178 domain-containing protein [Bordetella tumulicola]|uniref:DUF4178 domain-containing protein n=1 Tax=Bordetella tumulicola TaxID=1649133 RepID=UPI0039F013E7
MQQVLCPQCGAPVKFTSTASVMAVCGACRSTLLKDAESVKHVGEMADVLEDYSPICLGASGIYDKRRFTVVGRIQLRYDDGFWNEWYIWFDDGSDGWLSDASGQYAVTHRRRAQSPLEFPTFFQIAPGAVFDLDGQHFIASDIRSCRATGVQGELPFVPDTDGWEARVADYRSLDAFLTLDYSDGDTPEVYVGHAFKIEGMDAASLRGDALIEETAGRFRGQITALDCPNCGAPISFVAAMATQVVCPTCQAMVDCTEDTARVIERQRKVKATQTTLALGAEATIDGTPYTLIGLLKCADPDPDEPSDWVEYLLFSPKKGFLWLVESDEGWERVHVCDTWPSRNNSNSFNWRSKTYRKLYDYTSKVTLALGAFNWRVKVGDTTQISDYQSGNRKLTREEGLNDLGWSASVPVQPSSLAQWFGQPELASVTASATRSSGDKDTYRSWAMRASIAMLFLNLSDIFSIRILMLIVGLILLWVPASMADKFNGEGD